MPKGLYVGNASAKASKVKKLYVGDANNKARKLKKLYVGDANGKARLFWSSASSQYMITTSSGKVHLSEDAVNWEQVSVPLSRGCSCVYGNGTYVMLFDPYVTSNTASSLQVATSKDGKTWTLRTIGTVTPMSTSGYTLNFCNGIFIVTYNSFESGFKYHVYTSADGVTWQKKGNSTTSFNTKSNGQYCIDIVYGRYNNKNYYIKCNSAGIDYSTDLLTWTSVNSMSSSYIKGLVTIQDGTLYMISSQPAVYKVTTSASSIWTGTSGYVPSNLVYSEEDNELYWVAGQDAYNTTSNFKRIYKTTNLASASSPSYFNTSKQLSWGSLVCGNGKLSFISANNSSSDIARNHYSLDGGATWTTAEIGTVGNTGISYSSSIILFTKGE